METVEILTEILNTIVLSGGLQKFNNLQHYQYAYNVNKIEANNITLDAKTIHSLSINVEQINSNNIQGSYNLILDDTKINYTSNLVITATTLFDKEISIEVLPNTILTIIKQY